MSLTTDQHVNTVVDQLREKARSVQDSLLFELLRIPQDKKIARIKEVRAKTGLNLKDAKAVIDRVNADIPFVDAYFKTDRLDQLQTQLRTAQEDKRYAQREQDVALSQLADLKREHLHLQARLGARDREVQEHDVERARVGNLIGAASKVAETLAILQPNNAVVKGLTSALIALLEDALDPAFPDDDIPF